MSSSAPVPVSATNPATKRTTTWKVGGKKGCKLPKGVLDTDTNWKFLKLLKSLRLTEPKGLIQPRDAKALLELTGKVLNIPFRIDLSHTLGLLRSSRDQDRGKQRAFIRGLAEPFATLAFVESKCLQMANSPCVNHEKGCYDGSGF